MKNTGSALIAFGAIGVIASFVYISQNPFGFTAVCLLLSGLLVWGGINFESFVSATQREHGLLYARIPPAGFVDDLSAWNARGDELMAQFHDGTVSESDFCDEVLALFADRPKWPPQPTHHFVFEGE